MTTAELPDKSPSSASSSSATATGSEPVPTPSPALDYEDPARASGIAPSPLTAPALQLPSRSPNVPPPPSVLHPRGRIWPPLSRRAPMWQRFVRGVVRLVQGLYHHEDIFHMAPAMAFHFFLSLLPLLVFIGYLIGLVAEYKGASAMLGMLLDNLPSTTEAMLKQELGGLTQAKRLGPLAAIGFFWIASGGTQGLMQAIERVVGVPPRAWWRQRLLALAWVLGTVLAVGVGSFSVVQWDEVVHVPDDIAAADAKIDEHDGDRIPAATTGSTAAPATHTSPMSKPAQRARKILRDGGERVIAILVSLVVAVVGLAGFYHFAVAHSRRVKRRTLPGAVVAVGLVIIITWGFSLYVRTLASYTVYYGSLAAMAVLLVWLWLMSIAILVGAELNSQLEGLRDHPRAPSFTTEP